MQKAVEWDSRHATKWPATAWQFGNGQMRGSWQTLVRTDFPCAVLQHCKMRDAVCKFVQLFQLSLCVCKVCSIAFRSATVQHNTRTQMACFTQGLGPAQRHNADYSLRVQKLQRYVCRVSCLRRRGGVPAAPRFVFAVPSSVFAASRSVFGISVDVCGGAV